MGLVFSICNFFIKKTLPWNIDFFAATLCAKKFINAPKNLRGKFSSPIPSSNHNQNGLIHFFCFTLGLNNLPGSSGEEGVKSVWKCAYVIYEWPLLEANAPNHVQPPMMMRRPDSSDDRHVIAKHGQIYPTDEQLASIQKQVNYTIWRIFYLLLISTHSARISTKLIEGIS